MEPKKCARAETHGCPGIITEPKNWVHKYCDSCRVIVNREQALATAERRRQKRAARRAANEPIPSGGLDVDVMHRARARKYQQDQLARKFAAILDREGFVNYEGKEKYSASVKSNR